MMIMAMMMLKRVMRIKKRCYENALAALKEQEWEKWKEREALVC